MADSELELIERRKSERTITRLKVEAKEIESKDVEALFLEHAYKDLSTLEQGKNKAVKDAITVFTQNISVGGLMLISDEPFHEGAALAVAVHLADLPMPVHALALVMWTEKEGETRTARPALHRHQPGGHPAGRAATCFCRKGRKWTRKKDESMKTAQQLKRACRKD